MQEVEGFLSGDYDYMNLKGDTGPLVYPAGFVYLFSALYFITDKGTNILLAQYLFLGFYLIFIAVVAMVYHKSQAVSTILYLMFIDIS
jgi:alpha-1,3-mannosyltransferase